jgi:hypothetical protein
MYLMCYTPKDVSAICTKHSQFYFSPFCLRLKSSMTPTRVAFFIWSSALGKILMYDNLRKMNVIVIEW